MVDTAITRMAVFLGRFSPFQKGHASIVKSMIERFGLENCLLLIGSSNTLNERTPFSYEQRSEMIHEIFPKIKILALPDGKPNLIYFDGSTNDQWLDSIQKIEKDLKTNFVFFGGSSEDLKILSERFQTEILVDRSKNPNLSATSVRKALRENNDAALEELVDLKVIPLAKKYYQKFVYKYEKTN